MKIKPTGVSYMPAFLVNALALAVMCLAGEAIYTADWWCVLLFQLFILLLGNELWIYGVLFPALSQKEGERVPDPGDKRLRLQLKRTSPLMFLSPCLVAGMLRLLIWSLDRMGVVYPSAMNSMDEEVWLSFYGLGLLFVVGLFLPLVPLSVFSLLNTEDDDAPANPPPLPPPLPPEGLE